MNNAPEIKKEKNIRTTKPSRKNFFSALFNNISIGERVFLARHLAVMTKSGLPLTEALSVLKNQSRSKNLARMLGTVIQDIENGQLLSESLSKFPKAFDNLFINIVKVGETSGTLSENLLYIAGELKKSQELNKKVKSALVYPLIILVSTLGIGAFLVFVILPKIIPIFKSLQVKLPLATIILIAVSNFLIKYFIYIIIIFVLLIILIRIILNFKIVKYYFNLFLLKLPIIQHIIRGINLIYFSRTLGILLKSGLQIVDALEVTASTLPSPVFQEKIKIASNAITRGQQISVFLKSEPAIFPALVANMIEVGEKTGKLEENALYLAEFYEGEVDDVLNNLSNILEPVLMVFMGLIVGFIAIAIISPIYQITQSIKLK